MKLRKFRETRNLSRREVAESIDISIQSLERYESGKSEPNISTLIKLAKFFGVSVDTLIGNDAELVDLTTLDENRKYVVNKVVRELDDVQVGKLIGYMDK